MAPHEPVLFATKDGGVVLIDIPASIADAQDLNVNVTTTPPLCKPLPSTEPKSEKARLKILATAPEDPRDAVYKALIEQALKKIHAGYFKSWTNRPHRGQDGPSGTKSSDQATKRRGYEDDEAAIARELHDLLGHRVKLVTTTSQAAGVELHIWNGTFFNPRETAMTLTVASVTNSSLHVGNEAFASGRNRDFTFHVPAASSFVLADCNSSDSFRRHMRWISQEHDNTEGAFDFILLDPPWENRSARRRSAYQTSGTFSLLDNLDVAQHLKPRGYLGIWITNKAAVRQYVEGPGGLLQRLNVAVLEEWIWVKTTLNGEPVYPLDGIWRKPYEIFLLARAPDSRLIAVQPIDQVKRRVIAAVPDFHSRKPCLKSLIETYLPEKYKALEVFGRYLVAGWTSWGNEVLKYSWQRFHEETLEVVDDS